MPSIVITHLKDMYLEGERDRSADVIASERFTICSSFVSDYKITASSHIGSNFALKGEGGDEINYQVLYRQGYTSEFTRLHPNQRSNKYTIEADEKSCQHDNSELKVVIPFKEINTSTDANYFGALLLLLEVI